MAVQRSCYCNLQSIVNMGDLLNQYRQIPFHVQTEREEVGNYYDSVHSALREPGGGPFQVGLAQFEECGLDMRKAPGTCQSGGSLAD